MSRRVYEIAREQSLETKEVIRRLREAGVEVNNPFATVEDSVHERVFGGGSDGRSTTGIEQPLAPASSGLPTPRALAGSLPLDFKPFGDGDQLVPAVLFAPPHLLPAVKTLPPMGRVPGASGGMITPISHNWSDGSSSTDGSSSADGPSSTDVSSSTSPDVETASADVDFLQHAKDMLGDGSGSGGFQMRFKANSDDASYDFDEYVLLRSPDDPYASGLTVGSGGSQTIPSDPRFQRFLDEAEKGISQFVASAQTSLVPSWPDPNGDALRRTVFSWWRAVCAVRAFNMLGRYNRSEIKDRTLIGDPAVYYGLCLWQRLQTGGFMVGALGALREAAGFRSSGDSGKLGKLLTVAFWENVLTSIFEVYFDDKGISQVDPTAPEGEYPFDPFRADEVLFGLRVVHRQTWHLLGYARGELVKTIPLGPRESQKVNVKILRRRKVASTTEEATSFETTSETSSTTKATSEVIDEASEKLNRHGEGEVSGGYGAFFQAKVSAGISEDLASSSKQTKGRLNEQMQKTASRMKRDTKVTVSTETEETFEDTRASELTNPNDEVAVTYLYHRLQQRHWVSTEIAETHSVVFVPEPLPDFEDVDEEWVRQHGEVIAGALLDPGLAPIVATIRKEPATLAYQQTDVFGNAAKAGIDAATIYKEFSGGGDMPDMLASGPQFFERDYERRNNLAMDQVRRNHQSEALLTHIRRNILHYMRAIWASEDYDQRMQRYSRIRVPTAWYFVPRTPLPTVSSPASPLEVDGVFMPDPSSARPLSEVIDPIGPIDYLFNCAVYQLRDDPKLANLHQALAYVRAAYTRFAVSVTVSPSAGVTLRQAIAYAPRNFSVDYTFTYRTSPGKWLIPVPGKSEADWLSVKVLPDGSLDALGLRIWLDGTPVNQATLTISVRATGDLEDPHLRLVQMQHPLPAPSLETGLFTEDLLREMVAVLPELAPLAARLSKWSELTETQKIAFRERYHLFLMLRNSGRLVTLDTANVVLDLETSNSAALEPFKRLHRYLDVRKEFEELRRRELDNARREELLKKGVLGDPDIDRVTVVGTRDDIEDAIALPDAPDE